MASIPLDENNRDYAEYLAWVEAGNTPEDPPYVAPVPQIVSRFQAKAVLLNEGLLSQVEALMQDANTPELYRLAWAEAREFERASPTVAAMSAALGLTEQQVDDLFVAASKITA
jgi:hypothetical protein